VEPPTSEHVASCPLCGHRDYVRALDVLDHHLTKQKFRLVDCASCGFRFTSPRPCATDLSAYYESQDYISHDASGRTSFAQIYRGLRSLALRSKASLLQSYTTSGHILDIGCGTGEFLAHLTKLNYTATGVEPGLRAREAAIRAHNLQVFSTLEDIPVNVKFQAVTLWHVLEHVPSLLESLRRYHDLLEKGGHLLIAVPDRSSWDAQYYKSAWAAWDVPRHLWHFRESDVLVLLSHLGFRVVATRRMWFDAYYIALLSERYKGRPSWLAWTLALLFGTVSNLSSIITGRPTSSSLFVAEKLESYDSSLFAK